MLLKKHALCSQQGSWLQAPIQANTLNQVRCAGIALTMLRHLPSLAKAGLVARDLTAPFARIVDQEVTNPWLRNLMDLECFVLRCGFSKAQTRHGMMPEFCCVLGGRHVSGQDGALAPT